MRNVRILVILVVIVHMLVQVPHAAAHNMLHIEVSRWQNIYILVVINLLPSRQSWFGDGSDRAISCYFWQWLVRLCSACFITSLHLDQTM
jgi:hypothetical protein